MQHVENVGGTALTWKASECIGVYLAGDCIRELRNRADDVIEAGCTRRLVDKDVVGRQSIEPHALRRRGEKAPQSFDSRGNLVVGAPAREIGTNPFGLRPQARDGVVDAAVGK